LSLGSPPTGFEQLVAYCRADGRVCPAPKAWKRLWDLLPEKLYVNGHWRPALPLILAGWWASDDASKRARLIEHLTWARDHGALDDAKRFLFSLSGDEWHVLSGYGGARAFPG
jgi:hypothetical protein